MGTTSHSLPNRPRAHVRSHPGPGMTYSAYSLVISHCVLNAMSYSTLVHALVTEGYDQIMVYVSCYCQALHTMTCWLFRSDQLVDDSVLVAHQFLETDTGTVQT